MRCTVPRDVHALEITMTRHRNLLAALAVPLILSACSHGATSAPPSPVVAEVNGRAITLAQLDEKIASQLYDARSQGLELLIADLVIATEAERRGVSQQELVEQQAAVLGEVTDEEVAQFFASNRARMRPEDTLEKIGPEIRRFLERNQHDIVLRSLRCVSRQPVNSARAAAKGPCASHTSLRRE